MTPFWKEERWGYNIYQNEQNLFFLAGPPYTLNDNSCTKRPTSRPFSNLFCIEIIAIIPSLKRKDIYGRLLSNS